VVDAREDCFDEGRVCAADLIFLAAPIGGIIGSCAVDAS
jgi:hypothetical protein